MKPPYKITAVTLSLIASISEKIGEIKTAHLSYPQAELRKQNRIKTIQSSLEIEGNTLTVEQVTALLDNKRVVAPQKDILEVKNAIETYSQINKLKPHSIASLCQAHKLLMQGLVDSAGQIRATNVGIAKGSQIAHVAPPAHLVKAQLESLLSYLKNDPDLLLIKSCVFHYELEYIHPFVDGNGRMGRLWQTVILRQQYPVFDYLPMETLVKHRQKEYYQVLAACDKQGESTLFIEFMLSIISDALEDLLSSQPANLTASQRILAYKSTIKNQQFSRKDYLRHYKNISTATASRDLKEATLNGMLTKEGEGRLTTYQYTE